MSRKKSIFIILAVVLIAVLMSSVFVVHQREYALVFKFGRWSRTIGAPGLHFKLPTPFERVVRLDNRLQSIESGDTERIQTSEKKNLIIDSYVKWRILDPLTFYVSFGASTEGAQGRLSAQVRDALNASVNTRTVKEVISLERDKVMSEISQNISERAKPLGIEVVDVRLKRIEFSEDVSDSVFERMRAERRQEANRLRSNGQAESEKIRAEADKEVQEILAKATAEAEKIKGAGDAQANRTWAQAFGKDPDFYRFYGSLDAYRQSLTRDKNMMIIDANSDFLRFLKSPR